MAKQKVKQAIIEEEKKQEKQTVNIKELKLSIIKVKVIGKSPYIPEPMPMELLELYDKKKSNQTYEKDTESADEKAKKKFYYTDDGKYGIPTRQFYNAMIRASTYLFERNEGGMRIFREGININGYIIPLKYKKLTKATHWGRTAGITKAPQKIVRNLFHDWSCELEIEFNQSQLSAEQIINVLKWAGFYIGVGAFRKSCSGNYGAFTVEI
jgi:hypothetical protein